MGWSCSWIAVRGQEPDALLNTLGLQRTGELQEIPESRWSAATLPDGWFLVFCAKHCEPKAFKEAALAVLAAGCELVHSSVEEHVMFSSSAYWQEGRKVWEIVHDAQEGVDHLQASGELPPYFAAIRTRYFSELEAAGGDQNEVDYIFEVPLEVGAALTRFRHDLDYPTDDPEPFETLRSTPGAKKPWWKIW
jgi:hypothetical protein